MCCCVAVESISQDLSERYVERLLTHLVQGVGETAHLQFYSLWIKTLLVSHGPTLKSHAASLLPLWAALERNLSRRRKELAQV